MENQVVIKGAKKNYLYKQDANICVIIFNLIENVIYF